MLNELREYEQYTGELSRSMVFRLSYKGLTTDFAGIERPFTVIARRYLFDDTLFIPGADQIATTIQVLRTWFGMNEAQPEGLSEEGIAEWKKVLHWFPTYCLLLCYQQESVKENDEFYHEAFGLLNALIEETLENQRVSYQDALDRLNDERLVRELLLLDEAKQEKKGKRGADQKERNFVEKIRDSILLAVKKKDEVYAGAKVFTSYISEAESQMNTFKQISYEMICANALEQGPLASYVGVSFGGDFTKEIAKQTAKNIKKVSGENDKDIVTRFIFGYLLAMQKAAGSIEEAIQSGRRSEVMNMIDLKNSCMKTPKLERSERRVYRYPNVDPYPVLFDAPRSEVKDEQRDKRDNMIKIRLCDAFWDDWMEKLTLVKEEKEVLLPFLKAHKEQWGQMVLWFDVGSGEAMEKIAGKREIETYLGYLS